MMKSYIKPTTEVVSLQLSTLLQDQDVLRGSLEVKGMTEHETEIMGGDEGANISHFSLWEE